MGQEDLELKDEGKLRTSGYDGNCNDFVAQMTENWTGIGSAETRATEFRTGLPMVSRVF